MPPQAMHSTAAEAIMFSPCSLSVPMYVPLSLEREGGRVHYTHAVAEASYDRERVLVSSLSFVSIR